MSEDNINISYARITQKQGKSENFPILSSAEFGFSNDTGQLFIGSDPYLSTNVEHYSVSIQPFMNAQSIVQGYLDSHTDFSSFTVDNDLVIRAGNNDTAIGIMNYVNLKHNENHDPEFGKKKIIAFIDSNIEVVTNKNIHQYSYPAEFSINYSSTERMNSFTNRSYYKYLTTTDGNVFLEFPFSGALYVNVEYFLIQDDGAHTRAGNITLIGDTLLEFGTNAVLNDVFTALTNKTDGNIVFEKGVSGDTVYINFTQHVDSKTKIFYRISKWTVTDYKNIENYVDY